MQFKLTLKKAAILARESSGCQEIFHQLCRESIAREWLKSEGIPSWRNPVTPVSSSEILRAKGIARYSILLASGSRFAVCSYRNAMISRDALASAGCFAALAVELQDDPAKGEVKGYMPLADMSIMPRRHDFSTGGLEANSDFLHYLDKPRSYALVLWWFSLRLLLIGEPYPPEKDALHVPMLTGGFKGQRKGCCE